MAVMPLSQRDGSKEEDAEKEHLLFVGWDTAATGRMFK